MPQLTEQHKAQQENKQNNSATFPLWKYYSQNLAESFDKNPVEMIPTENKQNACEEQITNVVILSSTQKNQSLCHSPTFSFTGFIDVINVGMSSVLSQTI